MATKNYMINDKWLDLDKQNIVELQSVDGELDSLKVNGSEIETPSGKITITENGTDIDIAQYALADVNVEGGGGSSDFSIATVTTVNNSSFEVMNLNIPIVCEENELGEGSPAMIHNEMVIQSGEETHKVCMYKGLAFCEEAVPNPNLVITVSGDIVYEEGNMIITGDCTITIS